ncbi:MAG: aliphatic sulfonate ABC transporter substrate-binding protein [Burkholderiaceae bacterium]
MSIDSNSPPPASDCVPPASTERRRGLAGLASAALAATAAPLTGGWPARAIAQGAAAGRVGGTLRIGYQKSSTLSVVLKSQRTLEQALASSNVDVSWHEFTSGLPLTEALNAGAIDLTADIADTVPIFAQAARADFVYFAQEAPSPSAQAILVRRDAPIRSPADLKGRRVAVTKAAGSHYLLLAALAQAGVAAGEVQASYLAPADGRAAFERGAVDAWITWDPFLAAAERAADARVLIDGRGLASYQRYYLVSSRFAADHPAWLKTVFEALRAAGRQVRDDPDAAARLLAPSWGLDAATVRQANARRSYEVRAVEARHFGEQQRIADTFFAAGLLPARVDTGRARRWDAETGAVADLG